MGHHRGKPVVYESSLAVQFVPVGGWEELWEAHPSHWIVLAEPMLAHVVPHLVSVVIEERSPSLPVPCLWANEAANQ